MAAAFFKNSLVLIRQVSLLFAVYLGGEFVVTRMHVPLPGSVVGMAIMTLLLVSGLVPLRWVEQAANLLLQRISLLLLPALVGLVNYWDLFKPVLLPLLAVVVGSTLAVMLSAAAMAVLVGRRAHHAND
jgi:holin-like protein